MGDTCIHMVDGPNQLKLYVTSWVSSARNQPVIYENHWFILLVQKLKMGSTVGGVRGNSLCQFETVILFSVISVK